MSTPALESVSHPRPGQGWAPPRVLVRLAQRRLRDSWLDRVASWVVSCLVLGSGALVWVANGSQELEAGELVTEALVVSSWSAGFIAALGAARPLADDDAFQGILRMLAVRGVDSGRLANAYVLATMRRLGAVVALPPIAIWLLALMTSSSSPGLAGRALLGGAILVYAAVYAVVVGSIVRWVTTWLPGRARTLLLAVIAVPFLASLIWPATPSLPELLRDFARWLTSIALGGA